MGLKNFTDKVRSLLLLFLRAVSKIVTEIIFFLCVVVALKILFIGIGILHPYFIFILSAVTFCGVYVIRNYVWRKKICHKPVLSTRYFLVAVTVFVLIVQIALLVSVPFSTVVPRYVLFQSGLVMPISDTNCNIDTYEDFAQNLWGDTINFNDIDLVEGGEMANLKRLVDYGFIKPDNNLVRGAMAFDTAIYVSDLTNCISGSTYVHEMAHMWQFKNQNKLLFGFDSIIEIYKTYLLQATNPDVVYDYGGYRGLKNAQQEGRSFLDFGIEQQAMLVTHYYEMNSGYTSLEGELLTSEYRRLLEIYIEDMQSSLKDS